MTSDSTSHARLTKLGLITSVLLVALAWAGCTPKYVPLGPPHVVGTLTLLPAGDQAPGVPPIELPDIEVFLQDSNQVRVGAPDTTLLDGKFRLRVPARGTYAVCWNAAGFGAGCSEQFTITDQGLFLGPVPMRSASAVIYGTVLTGDQRPCWVNDPFFNLDVATRMTLLDSAQQVVRTDVRANVSGEYAFGGVPVRRRYTVRAECERASAQRLVPTIGTSVVAADLSLPNRAPRIEAMEASQAGTGLTSGSTGAGITLRAVTRDPDGDPIEYLWRTQDGSGAIAATNTAQQSWTLAAVAGLHSVYLIARDGRGGYGYQRFQLPVGATGVGFSGRVIDEVTQLPVANANVSVSGTTAITNPQGWFNVSVAPQPAPPRYVVNISHPQYTLLSRIHDRAGAGNTYEMIRVQTTTHDPAQVIDVIDSSSTGPCGPRTDQAGMALRAPTIRELRDSTRRAGVPIQPIAYPCRHRGAQITVPAGALVDAAGNPPAGNVTLAFATLNPARRALPGDYRAVDRNNTAAEMLSYGALSATFRDGGGNPLNLRAGVSAEIRVPVSDAQRPSAPAAIAIWAYDEATGMWKEEGQASLQNTAQGWMYVGPTTHFSELNMDVAGSDPAQATCVRFEVDASLRAWSNLIVRAYVSYAGTSVQVKETALDGNQYHAVYRIPFAPPAPGPNSLRLEVRGTYSNTEVVLLDDVINTDARPKMTGTNLWPPYPYSECGVPVVLTADPVTLPYYGDIDATGRPAFLTGPNGDFLPVNGDQEATAYYNTIDPGDATNPNLSAWWTNHGFGADGISGAGIVRASYLNHNDLGFGRDMHCKVTGSDLACYVTNYGAPDQNAANADYALARDPAQRLATVAMEYRASEPADRRVRFFVYGGGDPTQAKKLKFADLDGLGPKPVPHLCTVCHGGFYDNTPATNNALHSRFREFDLPSFQYPDGRVWDYAPSPNSTSLSGAELTSFASLNKMVRDVAPIPTPIRSLIDAWYTGGFGAGTAPVKPAVPSGWSSQVNGYHNVYGKSCRTCHVARDQPFDFTFSTSAQYQTTDYAVCYTPKVMPNAYVTYKNFWSNLQEVIDYRVLTGTNATNCK